MLQGHKGLHGLFDRAGRSVFRLAFPGGPVNLIEVDAFHSETLQAALGFPANGSGLEVVRDSALLVPDQAAFGEHVRTLAQIFDRSSDDCFRVAQTVDGGRIDPVQSPIEARVNGFDGVLIVLRSPGKFPFPAAHRPCADADGRNM